MPTTKVVSAADARAKLSSLLSEIEDLEEHVIITRHGKPLAIMLAYSEYESLLETMEVLSDPDLVEAIREGEADIEKRNLVSLEEYLDDREQRLA